MEQRLAVGVEAPVEHVGHVQRQLVAVRVHLTAYGVDVELDVGGRAARHRLQRRLQQLLLTGQQRKH